jgi:hypothetical protein
MCEVLGAAGAPAQNLHIMTKENVEMERTLEIDGVLEIQGPLGDG